MHRDLKPENVIVRRRTAKSGRADRSRHRLLGDRLTGMRAFGTPPYVAPELTRGGKSTGGEVDIYALGQMIAEIWGGKSEPIPSAIDALVRKMSRSAPRPDLRSQGDCDGAADAASLVSGELPAIGLKLVVGWLLGTVSSIPRSPAGLAEPPSPTPSGQARARSSLGSSWSRRTLEDPFPLTLMAIGTPLLA